jgi:2,4-dienoyl-CoA reductase-like NADH-dependent reductase (Old Yellow Enzyme family)
LYWQSLWECGELMADLETWKQTALQDLELPNGVVMSNRIMRAATWMGQVEEDGSCGDRIIETYRLIKAGLVVTGFQFVLPEGQQLPRMISNTRHEDAKGLKRLAEAIHKTGSLAAAQLVHCGAMSNPMLTGGQSAYGPSSIDVPTQTGGTTQAKGMTLEHVEKVTQAYADAARRAFEVGFDVIELHGAHQYGLWQFFDPTYNQRPPEDPYTGSTMDGRSKAMVDAVKAVKAAVDIPVQVKVDSSSQMVAPEEVGELAKRLAKAGAWCVIVSGPNAVQNPKKSGEAYFLDAATIIRSAAKDSGIRFGLVGGIRSPETIVELLTKDGFDVVQLGRPLITESALLDRWAEEAERDEQQPSRCISCNGCFRVGITEGVRCTRFPEM